MTRLQKVVVRSRLPQPSGCRCVVCLAPVVPTVRPATVMCAECHRRLVAS